MRICSRIPPSWNPWSRPRVAWAWSIRFSCCGSRCGWCWTRIRTPPGCTTSQRSTSFATARASGRQAMNFQSSLRRKRICRLDWVSRAVPLLCSLRQRSMAPRKKGRARSLPLPVTKAAGVAAGARGSAGNVLWSSRAGARQSRGLARKSRMAAGPAGTTLSRKGRISRSRLIRLPREKAERNRTSTAAATVHSPPPPPSAQRHGGSQSSAPKAEK